MAFYSGSLNETPRNLLEESRRYRRLVLEDNGVSDVA